MFPFIFLAIATTGRETSGVEAAVQIAEYKFQRMSQVNCTAPSGGCGAGLWDENFCQCLCTPSYCIDSWSGKCGMIGDCPNAFVDCTTGVNCPYFPNPATGGCESGPEVMPGVYELFWTEEECCNKVYAWDPSSCIKKLPTKSPTQISASSSWSFAPTIFQMSGVVLPEIPIVLLNLPYLEVTIEQESKLKDVILYFLSEISSKSFNFTVLSVDIVDAVFSDGRFLAIGSDGANKGEYIPGDMKSHPHYIGKNFENQFERDLENHLTFRVKISVSETSSLAGDVRSVIISSLQDRRYEIDDVLRESFGSDLYTGVILDIDGAQTSVAPSPSPSYPSEVVSISSVRIGGGDEKRENNNGTFAIVIVFSLLFASVCCGIIIYWQRRRIWFSANAAKISAQDYFISSPSLRLRRKRKTRSTSRGRNKTLNVSDITLKVNNANSYYIDEEQNKMEQNLIKGYRYDLDKSDRGYDGGKSSYLESQGNTSHDSWDDASEGRQTGIDPDDASGGNSVLGLMYYAGASSADEDEHTARRSRKSSSSRNSRRSTTKRQACSSDGKPTLTRSRPIKSKSSSSQSRRHHSSRLQQFDETDEEHQGQIYFRQNESFTSPPQNRRASRLHQFDQIMDGEHPERGFYGPNQSSSSQSGRRHSARLNQIFYGMSGQHPGFIRANQNQVETSPNKNHPGERVIDHKERMKIADLFPAEKPHYSSCSESDIDDDIMFRRNSRGESATMTEDLKSLSVNSRGEYELFS